MGARADSVRQSDQEGTLTVTEIHAATPEVVGTFADRAQFQTAIDQLLQAGFDRADISVLSSHQSLDATQPGAKSWRDVLTAVAGDIKYEGPLVVAGLIALASGPVGAAIAGLVAAGIGGAALREVLAEVAALPDPAGFERALAAGSVILWVAVADPAAEAQARQILAAAGGANIHVFNRKGR